MSDITPIDWTLPAADILAELLTDVWQPTDAAITVAEIVAAVGTDAARLVVGTLQAGAGLDPLLSSSYQAISTVGMSLSGADRQAMIDELAVGGSWPDAVRDAVKALGGVWVKRWSLEGFDAEPTLAEATAAQAARVVRASQATAREQINAAVSLADAARFAAEQAGSDGENCVVAWLAEVNEVLG
jgi:hypothetical protein